jgi:DNA-binding response OmpR family regulator
MSEQASGPNASSELTTKLIFIVEDDENIGILIVQTIHQETSHRAIHHPNGSSVLQAVRLHRPHLFILDYSLPDMTGLELHDQLHTFEHLKDTPTILISALKPPASEILARQITYLRKPFDLGELLEAIEMHLNED